MLDLSREKLIPLKTMAKRRDGGVAIFVHSTVTAFRFCPPGGQGTYTVAKNGKRQTNCDSEDDIMEIARPWVPKNGERVRVIGYAQKQGGSIQADIIADSAETRVDDASKIEDEELVFIRNLYGRYLVDKRQLRRWISVASEELP